MEKTTKLLATAFCFFMLTVSSHAGEFLSVDCGAVKGHTDQRGIQWVTDDGFIETGTNLRLDDSDLTENSASLKYFPEGRSKNCYVLPVRTRTTYLIRARFFPGNLTAGPGIESPVNFNVTVNNNLLLAYSAEDESNRPSGFIESIIHTFLKNQTYLCLLRGTAGFPFINSIELRELNITSYTDAKDNNNFLIRSARYNTGSRPDDETAIRYPDDPYDRIWFPTPPTEFPDFRRVENLTLPERSLLNLADDGYNWPPNIILQDAWVGRNLSSGSFPKPAGEKRLYVAFYTQEIRPVDLDDLEANPVGMIFGVNNNFLAVNLTGRGDKTLWFTTNIANDVDVHLTVDSQPWSKQEAILNGFEIYFSNPVDTSETNARDRTTLKALQISFQLQDWTGDPCYPVAWDWVTCDPKTSKIIKLNLSNMSISGSIPEEISRLIELVEIHLDNNDISGSIPPSMRSLTKLKVLALDNNNLSGEIPVSFQDRAGFTFTGNPRLCLEASQGCTISSPPTPAPPVRLPSAALKAVTDHLNKRLVIGVVLTLVVLTLA